MAMAVMPTLSATLRIDTALAPPSSRRWRAARRIDRAVSLTLMYTVYTANAREAPARCSPADSMERSERSGGGGDDGDRRLCGGGDRRQSRPRQGLCRWP